MLTAGSIQPLPSTPAADASHLENTSSQETAPGLRQGDACIEPAHADREFAGLVKVRQVEDLANGQQYYAHDYIVA